MSSAEAAIVLPPNEGFSPDAVGAIGLLVERLTRAGAGGTVLGRASLGEPFPGVNFRPVQPGWGLSRAAQYASGVVRALGGVRPLLIEVHNRPEIALRLLGLGCPVSLILNNDPQGMRGAQSPGQRSRMLARLGLVLTSSDWLRRRLLDGVPPPARPPYVLHNCIDLPPPPCVPRENLLLFAGRVVADKGADTFVAACARALPRLPGWRAQMIGADRFRADSPETPFVAALRPQAHAASVEMLGHRPNPDVLDAMQRAAIVVVPSRWPEPFGLVALEAMACGAALICSPRGGLPEVAGETALYADPDQPEAVAAAMLELAGNLGRRSTLAAAGRLRAQEFAAPVAAARLLAFRQGLLGE